MPVLCLIAGIVNYSQACERSIVTDCSEMCRRQRKVDEWSVMTLYNDVRHYEEQKQLKDKKLQEKAKTREELLSQMNFRQRQKEEAKEAERMAAEEQQERYKAWQQEKETLHQRKLVKMAEEREKAAQVRAMTVQQKKAAAETRLREEQRTLEAFKEQMEQDRLDKQRQAEERKQQYDAVMQENAKDLERKRMLKEKEREDDARLFKVQVNVLARARCCLSRAANLRPLLAHC